MRKKKNIWAIVLILAAAVGIGSKQCSIWGLARHRMEKRIRAIQGARTENIYGLGSIYSWTER